MHTANSPNPSDNIPSIPGYMHVVHEPARVVALGPSLNPEAFFMDLYKKYYAGLKKKLHCEDADDIVQETFKKLWIKRNELHLIIHPEQYLFTIARNIFLEGKNKFIRDKKIMKGLAVTEAHFTNATEEQIIFRDTRRVFDSWMHRLPVRLRQTYTLKKEGYKLKEIARHLDIKEQTVKNFLQKAEKKMEGLAEELGGSPRT